VTKYHKITIRLPKHIDELVEKLSKEMDITKSKMIRLAIKDYLGVYESPILEAEIRNRSQ